MNNIALPKKVTFTKGENPNEGIVTIEPCYPGYGTTLGSALRRVLISSLPGAAVVGVKIKGANHEFMALPHIKEDVLEIILNIKQLRLKIFGDEEVKLKLDVHGKKEVKAKDIEKNSAVEIVNPDLVLANITDMAGSLEIEFYVNKGMGYRPVENIENKKNEIGYIDIDSIFSPIISIGINVENTRVGKATNWDKLILNILTDGTITFEEAYEESAEILINQFNAIIKEKKKDKKKDEKNKENKKNK